MLLNNAGVSLMGKFVEQTDQQIDQIFDTNLKGAFLVGQDAARYITGASITVDGGQSLSWM